MELRDAGTSPGSATDEVDGDRTAATVAAPEPRAAFAGLAPGTHVDRYEIVEILGAGAMGIVYRAHDGHLSRDVALKLLHEYERFQPEANAQQTRLLREAQSLAQLSHPNVVAAYDVGTYEGAMFVAMELIEGVSLRKWLETPRPRREILRTLIGAGRGLAAAHAAGVTHRDFKPENVMVSADGRARVVDFGLARGLAGDELGGDAAAGEVVAIAAVAASASSAKSIVAQISTAEPSTLRSGITTSLLSSDLTQTGVSMGTPGYMAPEQLLQGITDARGDQYGYAATVFRALTGRKPYEASGLDLYRAAILDGVRTPWPRSVPRRIRRIVDRGLSLRPAERHPTLAKMVDELERAALGRRAWVWGTTAMAAVAVAAILMPRPPSQAASCQTDDQSFAGVWDAPRRDAIQHAFTASGASSPEETFALVAAELDTRKTRWLDMRRQACEATQVRGEQSDTVLALRHACLDRKLSQLETLTSLFAEADARLVQRAVGAARGLDPLDECADIPALLGDAEHLPADPVMQAEITRIRTGTDRIRALSLGGRWDLGLSEGEHLVADAERLGHEPTMARAKHRYGLMLLRNGRASESNAALRDALRLAARSQLDELVAQVSENLLTNLVHEQKIVEARALLPFVEANLERAPRREDLRGDFFCDQGEVLTGLGQLDAALASLEQARAIYTRLDDHALGDVEGSLGDLYMRKNDHPAAFAAYRRSVEVYRAKFGARHPYTLAGLNALAGAAASVGDRAVAESVLAESRDVADDLPADNPDRPYIAATEGVLHHALGEHTAAVPRFRDALAQFTATFGADGLETSGVHVQLATCLTETGQRTEAIAHLAQAIEIRRAGAAAPGDTAAALFQLAKTLATRAAPGTAIAMADPAAKKEPAPTAADRAHARSLASEAAVLLRAEPEADPAALAAIEAWIAARAE